MFAVEFDKIYRIFLISSVSELFGNSSRTNFFRVDYFKIVHYATSAMKRFLTSVSLQHEPKASDVITLVKKTFFARVSYEILYHEVWNKHYYSIKIDRVSRLKRGTHTTYQSPLQAYWCDSGFSVFNYRYSITMPQSALAPPLSDVIGDRYIFTHCGEKRTFISFGRPCKIEIFAGANLYQFAFYGFNLC